MNPKINLSTVMFFKKGSIPDKILLRDSSLLQNQTMSAFYGQSKNEGLMNASIFASKHNLDFIVIDFIFNLSQKIENKITLENISLLEFISFKQMNTECKKKTYTDLNLILKKEGKTNEYEYLNKKKQPDLHLMTKENSLLVGELFTLENWQSVKLISYYAQIDFCTHPLSIASFPFKHWNCISNVSCRINPDIVIDLSLP